MTHFYLSFVKDEQFVGATIVEADDVEEAVTLAWRRGVNPGGEVMILKIPPKCLSDPGMDLCIGRLATRAELLGSGHFRQGLHS